MRPTYPLAESLEWYIDNEHGVGRLLDLGPVLPRFDALYAWSAAELDTHPDLPMYGLCRRLLRPLVLRAGARHFRSFVPRLPGCRDDERLAHALPGLLLRSHKSQMGRE